MNSIVCVFLVNCEVSQLQLMQNGLSVCYSFIVRVLQQKNICGMAFYETGERLLVVNFRKMSYHRCFEGPRIGYCPNL